jgi:hypothetical protein
MLLIQVSVLYDLTKETFSFLTTTNTTGSLRFGPLPVTASAGARSAVGCMLWLGGARGGRIALRSGTMPRALAVVARVGVFVAVLDGLIVSPHVGA